MERQPLYWNGSHFDGLVQERRNSSALAMELRLSCTNPSICRSPILLWGEIDLKIYQSLIHNDPKWKELVSVFRVGNL